ncbi:MAG TPA: alpha/beta fold hydrolase [Acidimicrobiales bacterium]|jgi:carboxylesterase|nr:alpha/beta fold hydrolase [Acidimicrobiales bacterium]
MTAPVVAGAAPFSATGGDRGVLVLHGFTGSPASMRPLAESLADRGYSVELPRLPGHGTSLDDMVPTRWADWTAAAAASFDALAARCSAVGIAGLSMGGGLACWLAEGRPETAALVAINPLVKPIADELREGGRALLDAGVETIDGVANDIALEGADEYGYAGVPIAAAMSLMDGLVSVAASLASITCPTLVLTSRQDHVVTTDNSELVVATVAGPVEHVWLEKSYHVATLDFDAGLIEAETGRFLDAAFDGR